MMKRPVDLATALVSLAPTALWHYDNEDYSTLVWLSDDVQQPPEELVVAELSRLQSEYDAQQELAAEQAAAYEAAKVSALAKLAQLGLTEEEARIIARA